VNSPGRAEEKQLLASLDHSRRAQALFPNLRMDFVQTVIAENPGVVAAASGAVGGALACSIWMVWKSTFAMPDLSHRTSDISSEKSSDPSKVAREKIVFYELEHAPGGIASVSGFCAAVDAHLHAMDLDFEVKQAFKDKFPPRGKAPFLEHYKEDGTVTTVTDSDVILRYLQDLDASNKAIGLRRSIVPDSELTDSEDMTARTRASTIRLAKRLVTDRLYFVALQWAFVEDEGYAASTAGVEDSMPWPMGALFQMFMRRSMTDQCLAAAGGVARAPHSDTLRNTMGDLDALEDVVERLGAATGWLSGQDRPSTGEIAMWGHLATCRFEGSEAPLAKAVAARPALHKWIGALATYLFPDRVRDVGGFTA
jgi:glutathione S-transferase